MIYPRTQRPDTAQGRGVVPVEDVLEPVAEALRTPMEVAEGRGRPVPPGGIRAAYVKCSPQLALVAVLKQHVQLALARRMKVVVAVGVEVLRVPGGFVESVGPRRIGGRCVHGLVRVR